MKTEPNNLVYPASNQFHTHSGITIREHFAGLAMQGLCAMPDSESIRDIVIASVKIADLLIAELNRTQE